MTGSIIIIDLPGPVAAAQTAELGGILRGLARRFEEPRAGSYDVEIGPGRLNAATPEPADGEPRLFTVSITGPGFGDEGVFRAEHADDPELEPLIGYSPTHDVALVTPYTGLVDRLMLAELCAIVQEVVGGLVELRVSSRIVDEVRKLPGVVAISEEAPPRVFGSAEFIRGWAAHPEFTNYSMPFRYRPGHF
ncbi:hypothetical protein KGQ20_46150 [Catenulispora sp. NF23]|uniref:Uncharacterized protein n=1 Tax=Catenulispora pinistramenti TaxID=2705254 RepID=A0ABS5L705_9ACTN|nr:DUF6368 family protein [Catenulispora pinistramenti]MBS2540145.1 hypothetical protein [Catenulispora pinistramenti]MBS2554141.1 hypothetical protein [Catenulispora pinistramenti]